jgi:hypothetical protein
MRISTLHCLTTARLVVIAIQATLRTAASALSNPHIGLLIVCDENKAARACYWRLVPIKFR